MKALKTFLASLTTCVLLTSCGTDTNILGESQGKISTFSTEKDENTILLENLNKSIDIATSTKNTLNNYNIKFLMDGKNAFPAIENLIKTAKKSIYIEVFLFHDDYTGKKFSELLSQKAKQGLDVRLVYDFTGNSKVKLISDMAKNGVKVQTFNKDVFGKVGVNITHRKMFIADGEKAITGGMNIGENYEYDWHDTMVYYEGEAVKDTIREFIADWKLAGGTTFSYAMEEYLYKEFPKKDGVKTYPIRVAVTSPKEQGKKVQLKRMFLSAIDNAKKNIKVAMPYFSDDEFINHLIAAKQRGVDVKALMPYKSDQKLFDAMGTITTNQLVEAGIDVYRTGFKSGKFSHSKIMTIDDAWATIGSCNADARAFHDNQEFNVAISDVAFAQEVNKTFFDYHIQDSAKGVFKKVPWYKKQTYSFLEEMDYLI
ncbi:MAG: phosphatidylserine/phosphatidylglycerophosphate/cardiolipin synthase family protein [Candidatus Sericytochromatia bacterium]